MINSNGPWKKLLYFDRIVWIDNAPEDKLSYEKELFKLNYGCQLEHCKDIEVAKKFIQKRKDKKILIISSSKLIDQVIKVFQNQKNCYEKYIVFCGNAHSCERLMAKKQVYTAQYDQDALIIKIQQLQKLENVQARNIWVIMDVNEKLGIYKQKKLTSFLDEMESNNMKIQFIQMRQFEKNIQKIANEGFKMRIIFDNRDGKLQERLRSQKKLKNVEQVYQIVNKNQRNKQYFQRQYQLYRPINYKLVLIQELEQIHAYLQVSTRIKKLKIQE